MTKDEARAAAQEFVRDMASAIGLELLLLEDLTQEEEFGWVFFYDSKAYVEDGESSLALAGNAPFIIDRRTGALHETGTALPTERYLSSFRRYGDCHRFSE